MNLIDEKRELKKFSFLLYITERRIKMSFYKIYFSPTGGTKKVADIISEGIENIFMDIDMIKKPKKLSQINFMADDLCIFAVPSYGGRIPAVTVEIFRNLKGNGAKAVLMAVFGNRAIDDTLIELQDILEKDGFVISAGIEAVSQHSLMPAFGKGRPDEKDKKDLIDFGRKIKEKAEKGIINNVVLPGNHNYRTYNGVPFKPKTNGKCNKCGICINECPANAISKENPKITDNDKCISCMHCVFVCPQKARHCSKIISLVATHKMKKLCFSRKENKLYI